MESAVSAGLGVNIQAIETVSTPSTPSGPTGGIPGVSYSYSTGGSVSSLGHSVQYKFIWGDGTETNWLPVGTTSASHSWSWAGVFFVTARARCAAHGVESGISPSRYVSVSPGYANLYISGSSFHVYDNWTMSLYTNIPNTWFTMCWIFPNGSQTCTPNWGRTGANGNWVGTGSFDPGTAGAWREWIEFPSLGVRSNDIVFTVSDFANLSISSGFHVGNSWTMWLYTSIPNTWFTICAIHPDGHQSCTSNFGQTDGNGNWTMTGTFTQDVLGSWQEWMVFPTVTSNHIYFTVSP